MEELDLKEIFNMFWRRKIQIILIVVLFVAIGVIYSYWGVKPKYRSTTTAIIKQENTYIKNGEKVNETKLESFVPTYMELVKNSAVKKEVMKELKIEGFKIGSIAVEQIKDTEMVKVKVTNSDAEQAAKVANKLVEVTNKKIKEIYNIDKIYVIDEAEVNKTPININHKKDILIFIVIGLVVANGYVLLINLVKLVKE